MSLSQAAGFISRELTGARKVNHVIGYLLVALGVPAIVALVAFARARADWRQWVGLPVYLAFLV